MARRKKSGYVLALCSIFFAIIFKKNPWGRDSSLGIAGLKPVDVFTAGPASEKQMRHSREIKARVIGRVELILGRPSA